MIPYTYLSATPTPVELPAQQTGEAPKGPFSLSEVAKLGAGITFFGGVPGYIAYQATGRRNVGIGVGLEGLAATVVTLVFTQKRNAGPGVEGLVLLFFAVPLALVGAGFLLFPGKKKSRRR